MNDKTNLIINQYYKNSYRSHIIQKHLFNSNNYCEHCSIKKQDLKTLVEYDKYLNPFFLEKFNLMILNNGYTTSYELNEIYFDKFEIKFPTDSTDFHYEPFIIMLTFYY
jgi:hypothetical protein